jgi:hypothetical protein
MNDRHRFPAIGKLCFSLTAFSMLALGDSGEGRRFFFGFSRTMPDEPMPMQQRGYDAVQRQLDLDRLVFIDEAGAKTNMTRLYGRAGKGERVVDLAPHGNWCTTTMISSIRLNGSTACMAVDGSTTGDVFRAYIEHASARRHRCSR